MTDLTQLIADHRAQLLAELAICDGATAGNWHVHGSWVRDENTHGVAITENDRGTKDNATFIATARTALPDRIRENLRMLDALQLIWKGGMSTEQAIAESALRDILTPKENA